MSSSDLSWCVVIPAFNEEENLGFVLDDVLSTFAEIGATLDVIVIDDGSADRTGAIADEYAARDSRIRVIHHGNNRGVGAALATGYADATGDLVMLIPSDRQFVCEDLKRCLPVIPDNDVVVCVRRTRRDPFVRRMASNTYRMLMRMLFDVDVEDINWVKIYRRSMLRQIEIWSDSPFIDVEILVKASRMGARIAEVDVPHYPRIAGKATGASLSAMSKTITDLFRLHRRLRRQDS